MRFDRALGVLLLASAAALLSGHAIGQASYPNRPIKLIVHTPAGSSSDATGRMMAEEMGRRLGQPIVVENRVGAAGAIGVEAASRAPADGYTILNGASSIMVMLPAVSRRKLAFDPDADFVPIGRLGMAPFILTVNAKSNFHSLADVIKAAKAEPGKISYASAGPAGNPHLLGEMLGVVTGTSLNHVAYKGTGPAQVDLLGGIVDLQFDTPYTALPMLNSGRLRALGVTGTKRFSALPNVPTFAELGYPEVRLEGWSALYVPRGTPPAIVQKLRTAYSDTMQSPRVRKWFVESGGIEPEVLVGDPIIHEQRKSREVWRKLAEARGISLE